METMESAFKECFDQLPTGVFIVRQDTYKVLYCNNAMTRMSNGRIEPELPARPYAGRQLLYRLLHAAPKSAGTFLSLV